MCQPDPRKERFTALPRPAQAAACAAVLHRLTALHWVRAAAEADDIRVVGQVVELLGRASRSAPPVPELDKAAEACLTRPRAEATRGPVSGSSPPGEAQAFIEK